MNKQTLAIFLVVVGTLLGLTPEAAQNPLDLSVTTDKHLYGLGTSGATHCNLAIHT